MTVVHVFSLVYVDGVEQLREVAKAVVIEANPFALVVVVVHRREDVLVSAMAGRAGITN